MICAFLLYCQFEGFTTAEEVLEFYGSKRTFDSNGVTLPSQRRYVDYFSVKLSRSLQYSPTVLWLVSVEIYPSPSIGYAQQKEAHLQFSVEQALAPPFTSEVYTVGLQNDVIFMKLKDPLVLQGDAKFSFAQKLNLDLLRISTKPKFISSLPLGKLLHFWINTFFVGMGVTSPLTHSYLHAGQLGARTRKYSASASCLPMKSNYKDAGFKRTLHKTVSSAIPIANRFAALTVDDTPQSRGGGFEVTHDEDVVRVSLSKLQIDKAAKDSSGRFSDDFTICLNLRRTCEEGADYRTPDQDFSFIVGSGSETESVISGTKAESMRSSSVKLQRKGCRL